MRKSIKIMPGVRMTFSPRGVSTSVGVRGARMTLGSTGRVTSTLGIPGSGMSYTKTVGHVGKSPASRSTSHSGQTAIPAEDFHETEVPIQSVIPPTNFLSSRGEKALVKVITSKDPDELRKVAAENSDVWVCASTLLAFLLISLQRYEDSEAVFRELSKGDPANDPIFRKYFAHLHANVSIAEGVQATLPFGNELISLAYAEVLQMNKKNAEAIEIVENLEPNQWTALSLADLYCFESRWDDVIELVKSINNVDDVTALMITMKGVAFRETDKFDAAKECFKIALKSSKRDQHVLNRALLERAELFRMQKQYAYARRDAEKILVSNLDYPPVNEFLAKLDQEAPRKVEDAAIYEEHETALPHDDATDSGWKADPKGRHELRFFNGNEWTEFVMDKGVPGSDPV